MHERYASLFIKTQTVKVLFGKIIEEYKEQSIQSCNNSVNHVQCECKLNVRVVKGIPTLAIS